MARVDVQQFIDGLPCIDRRGHQVSRETLICILCGLPLHQKKPQPVQVVKATPKKRKRRRPRMDYYETLDKQLRRLIERHGFDAVAEALYKNHDLME